MTKQRFSLFPGPVKQRTATIPSNYGASAHANQEIKRTIDMASNRYDEALKVNGIPVMLWRRTMEGYRCTCRSDSGFVASEENENPTPTDQPRNDTVPRSDNIIRVRGSRQLAEQTVNNKEIVLGVDIGHEGKYANLENAEGTGSANPSFLDDPDLMKHFLQSGTTTTTCGICIGTGYTNGYSLYGGQRIVFDSHNLSDNDGFSIKDEDDAPLTYIGTEGARLEWLFEVPTFFKQSWITARDNIKSADVEIFINDQPLTLKNLDSYKGQIVTVSAVALNDEAEITHIEAILQFKDWPFTQADNLQDDTNYSTIEPTQTLDFPFSPSVQRINRGDLFFDFKYGKMWRANSVTDYKLTDGTVISWQVSATSRTRFDILSLLKVSIFPKYEISFDDIQVG